MAGEQTVPQRPKDNMNKSELSGSMAERARLSTCTFKPTSNIQLSEEGRGFLGTYTSFPHPIRPSKFQSGGKELIKLYKKDREDARK